MGKKRSKKKGYKPPPDPRTLPFLQEMFPNIEKDIVEIVFEQNEHDEEKTMQILTEMSSNDGSNPYEGILDDDSDLDEAVGNFGIELGADSSNAIINSSKKHSPPKDDYFISTDDNYTPPSSSKITPNSTNKRHSPQKPTPIPFTYEHPTNTITSTASTSTTTSFSSSSSSSSTPPLRTSSSRMASSTTGESGEFLSSMFPELDPTMVSLLYEENGNDVGKTVESLLSIVFMNHSSGNGEDDDDDEEAEALDEVESEALAEVAESEDGEEEDYEGESDEILEEEKEGSESEEYEHDYGEPEEVEEDDEGSSEENHIQFDGQFKFPISQPAMPEEPSETVSVASKSEFIQNLKLLAELFPETPRTLLALELDEHDGNLEKTIASCCRADPEYLRKLSGEKAIPELASVVETPKEEKKYPTPVNQVLTPTWLKKGASRPDIKYVPTPKPPPKVSKRKTSKSKSSTKPAATSSSTATPNARPMDLAAKLKMKQLREKFNFVDPDILEAVFVQSGHKVHATLVCLYDIYPHLRDASITHNKRKAEPSSPEEPLIRNKREKSTSTTTTTTSSTSSTTTPEKPRKVKRKKAATTEEGEDDGEFITVSYRKKKGEGASDGSPSVTPKKVMDSEDIENTYQSYREKAVKAGEMRNHFFMQAAAAYQAGDGARAKQLSQRGREYDEMMKDAHKQACHQIFIDWFDTLASVDLHGLHVAESLQVLSQLLEIHDQMGETNKKPKRLRVITGVGKHSIRGIAKIKPAVKNFLRSKGYRFAETEAGVITISLS